MTVKRFSVFPVLAFVVGAALEVGPYRNRLAAWIAWLVAALLTAAMVGFLIGRRSQPDGGSRSDDDGGEGEGGVPNRRRHELSGAQLQNRVFADITLEGLSKRYRDSATAVMKAKADAAFEQTWFRVRGVIRHIDVRHNEIDVSVESDSFNLQLRFPISLLSRFSQADKGFHLEAEAEFASAGSARDFYFKNCVLIYVGALPR